MNERTAAVPGRVSQINTLRGASASVSAWWPTRRISAIRSPVPSARRPSSVPTPRSRCDWVSALAPHGPGCSIASQVVATGAVPASGSPSRSENAEQFVEATCAAGRLAMVISVTGPYGRRIRAYRGPMKRSSLRFSF